MKKTNTKVPAPKAPVPTDEYPKELLQHLKQIDAQLVCACEDMHEDIKSSEAILALFIAGTELRKTLSQFLRELRGHDSFPEYLCAIGEDDE